MLEKGQMVRVYEDPITQKKFEGEAILVREYRPDEGDGLSMWVVRFKDEPGKTYTRTIYSPPANGEESEPRMVYFIMETERTLDNQYIPCIAVEGEKGFTRTDWGPGELTKSRLRRFAMSATGKWGSTGARPPKFNSGQCFR